MIKEEWKRIYIDGQETQYMVSSFGKVKGPRTMVAGSIKNSGYLIVSIHQNNIRYTKSVHRLVAQAFIENNDVTKIWVNHKDGNKLNNSLDNLEWVTPSYNLKHAISNNLTTCIGEITKIYDDEKINSVFNLYKNEYSIRSISRLTGISATHISDILQGKVRKDIFNKHDIRYIPKKHYKYSNDSIEFIKKLIRCNKSNSEIISILNLNKNASTKSLLARCRKKIVEERSTTIESISKEEKSLEKKLVEYNPSGLETGGSWSLVIED